MKNAIKITAIAFVGLFLFFLDRFIKNLFHQVEGLSFDLMSNLFIVKKTVNTGVAFGIPINYWLLTVLYIVIIAALVYLLVLVINKSSYFSFLALLYILFGAFSNLIDRIRFGYVIDYFYIVNFTIFNIADLMIVTGALVFIIINLLDKKNESHG